MWQDNEEFRHGSARWATLQEIKAAGYLKKASNSLHLGFAEGQRLGWSGEGAVLCAAPPRSGKQTTFGLWNALTGFSQNNQVWLSPKFEEPVVGFDQTAERRRCYHVTSTQRFGLPQQKLNPTDHIVEDSPTLEDDVQAFARDAIPESGGHNKYFDLSEQRMAEGLSLTIAEWDGELTLPALYDAANLIQSDPDGWAHFARHMQVSRFSKARALEGEITAGLQSGSNAFQGVVSGLLNALGPLGTTNVRRQFSPPFDFTIEEFVRTPKCNLYLGPQAEFLQAQNLIWRTILSTIATLKRRHLNAPAIDLHVDEPVLLAPFPLFGDIVNFGPGYGLRSIMTTQSMRQLDQLMPHGREIIMGGCAVKIFIGGGMDIEAARLLSGMLGTQTVHYNQELNQLEAQQHKRRAFNEILAGGDPFKAGMEEAYFAKAAKHRSKATRNLLNADEITRIPQGRGIILGAGLSQPLAAEFRPYFNERVLGGRFLPSPFFPPHDRIKVKSLFGHKWRPVRRGAPPRGMEDFPQFQNHDHVWVG